MASPEGTAYNNTRHYHLVHAGSYATNFDVQNGASVAVHDIKRDMLLHRKKRTALNTLLRNKAIKHFLSNKLKEIGIKLY